ncbi:MAG: hypothetical protein HYU60_04955 [Magnetospirillum sp.]|nr:hypothetical protein [Magnetospirillum sp.]
MFPGSLTMGAQDRLLPPSVPNRFFAAAVVSHLLAWAALLGADPAEAIGFLGGQGLVLAALHLVTLGVLVMTAMGAAIQLLPVATRKRLGPVWLCRVMFWLYVPGVAALTLGFWLGQPWLQHLGATLAIAGLAVFAGMMAANLRNVADLAGVTRHSWLALASLAGLTVLGLVLVIDFTAGFLPSRAEVATAHAVLAGYGFMGMLALGFSTVLIPMFVLGQAVPEVVGKRSSALAGAGLALGAGGALVGLGWLAALGLALGGAALAIHFRGMAATLKSRMRKRLEPFFRMVWVGWALLPASLAIGLALALGAPPSPTATLWGFLLVFGWLLTFVTGILQRIVPFLASMHTSGTGKPALLSALTPGLPLKLHFACHLAALALITAAILSGWTPAFRLGAAAGLAGAVAFTAFAIEVMRRFRAHLAAYATPPT